MNNFRSIVDVTPSKGFTFVVAEHPKRQPNAAPTIREVIQKFQVGIPIGQYVRETEFGDYENPTARPDFDFEKAAALNQQIAARRRLHLESQEQQPEATASKPSNEPPTEANPTEPAKAE